MQVIVNIPNECKEFADNIGKVAIEEDAFDNFATCMMSAVRVGTVFPENATNGDMIKAMFPEVKECYGECGCVGVTWRMIDDDYIHWFRKDWWNARYDPQKSEAKE